MTDRTNGTVVQRIIERAFNRGDLDVIDQLLAPEAFARSASRDGYPNGTSLKQLVIDLRTAFPDLCCTVEDVFQAGAQTAARWTIQGTHQGMLLGNRPTGRSVRVQAMIQARLAGQRIAELSILVDRFGMLQQLGIVPPATPAW